MQKKRIGGLRLRYFNTYYKTIEIKKVWYLHKNVIEQNGVQKKTNNYKID